MAGGIEKLSLKREVGLIGAISFIAGTMMGSGIFMSPQSVLINIGSPGGSLVIWAACGVLATLGSLCYAELGTVIPESGGEYIYFLRIFGQIIAFMFAFSFVIVMRPASATGIALSFAEYAVAPFYHDCTPPELVVKCVAAAGIMVLAIVHSMNVRLAIFIQVFCMCFKLVALTVIIVGGLVLLFNGNSNHFEDSFKGSNVEISSIGISLYQGLWSYDGWNTLNYLTEELKYPEVNLPRAVMVSIPMVTLLYLLVNVSYLFALTPKELMSSSAVAVTWGFTAWFFYAITLSGLLYLKIKKPELPRPYKVPVVIPILVLLAAIFLVLAPVIDNPALEYLYVTLFIFSGVLVYVLFIQYKICLGLLEKLTVFLQLFLEVAPAEKNL
ncbi:b(0,+)-type amino acid transporter 1-like isoform X4 [Esox lucius]|uniref:b(0,+)-type amino acid transporter 1-like isoform X4 n=1 Tax=Esox lucius TaxID=8010 RepID=UPI0014769C08|nr:b(0,+)-type amino acid transporter 1-like isoform X4 [Esox lucius]